MDQIIEINMNILKIPELQADEIEHNFILADTSKRRRHAKILHASGDEFNQVFNFMHCDSYMQPHLHPGIEKIEKIYIVSGRICVLYFDDLGKCIQKKILENGRIESIEVPAFTWHTYVILSERALTYETMIGVYEPETWKHMANWAPHETSMLESQLYLQKLIKISNS